MRDRVLEGARDWEHVVATQFASHFSTKDNDVHVQRLVALLLDDKGGLAGFLPPSKSSVPKAIQMELSNPAGTAIVNFHLLFVEEDGTATETPEGLFLRQKLTVESGDGHSEWIGCTSKATARVPVAAGSTTLVLENVELPAVEVSEDVGQKVESQNKGLPSRQWRQLGSVEKGLALQIGFKLAETGVVGKGGNLCCYYLDKAFFSTRI
eukprot:CAMPEP_0116840196 /NCGR_PEP_ID=MMETSP0418-20121206/10198_1 /TAXON_ID=1158023 /ORGANISM="Astrosyne radiata, Strain 13vi08-1A" /LENGTH=208 /DNA_ID=CAMNT_0004470411 /DNA_START=256 /DNA_END=882 /DNA_ORIENTATION=-